MRQIRAEIAKENDIAWVVEECTHKGDCKGTCPKCEAEVRQLERELEKRASMGKKVAVLGVAAGLSLSITGCAAPFASTTDGVDPDPQQAQTRAVEDGQELPEIYTATAGDMLPYPEDAFETDTDEDETICEPLESDTEEWVELEGDPVPEAWGDDGW